MSAVRIRAARAEDAAVYARLFAELGLGEPPPSATRIAALLPRMQIAESDAPCGFVMSHREGEVGFVRQIVVAPGVRRAGIGRALMAAAAERLRSLGVTMWRLNVKSDNTAALALYHSLGMRVALRSSALWITPEAGPALVAGVEPLVVVEAQKEDASDLEREFEILAGQLQRPSSDARLCVARRAHDRAALGVMYFEPSFPGAFPFCARTVAAARALLGEAFRITPTAARIGIVIERDAQLVEELVAAGAQLRFHMMQLEGAL